MLEGLGVELLRVVIDVVVDVIERLDFNVGEYEIVEYEVLRDDAGRRDDRSTLGSDIRVPRDASSAGGNDTSNRRSSTKEAMVYRREDRAYVQVLTQMTEHFLRQNWC